MVKMRLNSGHCNSLKRQLFSTHPWTKLWQQTVLKSGYSFWVWKVKPKQKGLKPVLFLKAGRQWLMQLQKYVQLWSILWGNQPSAPLLFHLSKPFPDNFMVSVASVGSNWIKHEVCFVKCWSLLGRHGPGVRMEFSVRLLSLRGIRPWAGPSADPIAVSRWPGSLCDWVRVTRSQPIGSEWF